MEVVDRTMDGESVYPDRTPQVILGNATSYEFSEAEVRVLRLLVEGMTYKQMADALGITVDTVKAHVSSMLSKTGFTSKTKLAAVVISFPLMYRSARAAFEQVDTNVIYAARTLGISENRIFWKIIMPLARPGVAAGGVLAYARGLGEFGATAMIAGNIAGKTRTLPLAVYSKVAGNDMEGAYIYVAILVAICFIVVIGMNYFSAKESKYQQRAEK